MQESAVTSGGVATLKRPAAREVAQSSTALARFFGILVQLVLLLALVSRFQIENEAFIRLTALTVGGFAIHYFLQLRHRLPFFVLLSFAGIVMVLGVVQAAWLIGIGLVLIALSHLPIHVYARAALLLTIGGLLAIPRWGLGEVPWSAAIWPVLGSMFVFRMLSYLYDRAHGIQPTGVWQTLAYFFLLPNICFPLFPVIDFKRFCRSYYDGERHDIYQVGVEWIWRGVIQLLLYRLVYFHLTLDPVAVANVADLGVYMLSTFLLYVRLSGYFHIVIGMLHLFGFNLPETHHRYFLASSFTDFWRRINIYWKDFMMKVFYYPAFFRLRRLGERKALVLATLFTFVVTWFLHMVQWFWIRGSVFMEWNDVLFWSLFAGLVLVNSLSESREGRSRTILRRERGLPESIGLVLRTIGTFATICVMWSLWTAESATDWALMLRGAMHWPAWTAAQFAGLAAVVVLALGTWVYGTWRGGGTGQRALGPRISLRAIVATSLLLCAATIPNVTQTLGASGEVLDTLRLASASGLNRRDAEDFQRGYYENLLDVGKFNSELRQSYEQMPADFVRSLSRLGLSRSTGNEQDYELVPLKEGRFLGAMVRTNQWGMRDKDYSRERPASTYRIALTGPSTAMASGVEAEQSFESVLEDRLNREDTNGTIKSYQVLNFGVAGYAPLHSLYQLTQKVFAFEPNAVLYLGHSNDVDRTASQWTRMLRRRSVPSDPYLQELARRTGIRENTGTTEARRRMKPYASELQEWVYRSIVAECRKRNVEPIFVYLELVTEPAEPWRAADRAHVLELARKAGFQIVDLTGVYTPYRPEDLWVIKNDGHANALGNRLIGNRLHDLMLQSDVVRASHWR